MTCIFFTPCSGPRECAACARWPDKISTPNKHNPLVSVPGVLILSRCLNFRLMQSKTISRVMSCVIIYPMELSPVPLSDPPENMTGSHIRFLFGLASDGVYMAFSVTRETVVSYTAFPPLPEKPGGISLLHYPWSRLRRTLLRHPALRSPDFPHLAPFGPASRDYISTLSKRNSDS